MKKKYRVSVEISTCVEIELRADSKYQAVKFALADASNFSKTCDDWHYAVGSVECLDNDEEEG